VLAWVKHSCGGPSRRCVTAHRQRSLAVVWPFCLAPDHDVAQKQVLRTPHSACRRRGSVALRHIKKAVCPAVKGRHPGPGYRLLLTRFSDMRLRSSAVKCAVGLSRPSEALRPKPATPRGENLVQAPAARCGATCV
jgi:hypothetical protein